MTKHHRTKSGRKYQLKSLSSLLRKCFFAFSLFAVVPAKTQESRDHPYPVFDAARHTPSEVVDALYKNVFLRLRMHFNEEALVVALETADRFNGKLSPRDQMELDELVAKCLMLNDADLNRAGFLFEQADRVRTENQWHEEARQEDTGSISEGLSSSLRLPLWAAECALKVGNLTRAGRFFQHAARAGQGLFKGDFHELLRSASESVGKHAPPSLEGVEALDASYWDFWDDLQTWSRLTLGKLKCGHQEAVVNDPEFSDRIKAVIGSGLIQMESLVDTTEYRFHQTGPGCLEQFLDLAVEFVESRGMRGEGPALAKQIVDQLADGEEDHDFAEQPARLIRLIILHRGKANDNEVKRLMGLLQKAELWRETGVFPIVAGTFVQVNQASYAGEAVLFGKNPGIGRLARELDRAQRFSKAGYPRYVEAFGSWIDHRLRLGYQHPATVKRWDAAGDVLWQLSAPAGDDASRLKAGGVHYPDLGQGMVAIELIRLPRLEFQNGNGWKPSASRFVAVVFDPGKRTSLVTLGEEAGITQAVMDFRSMMTPDQFRAGKAAERNANVSGVLGILSDLLLGPLRQNSSQALAAGTWVVGLDGTLEMLPLFALTWEGRELGIAKNLIHVSQVAGWRPRNETGAGKATRRALLIGRPDYATAPAEKRQSSTAARSFDPGIEFDDLPGTGAEISSLAEIFRNAGIPCTTRKEAAASEREIRSVIRESSIIHMATHGYCLPNDGAAFGPTKLSESDALFRSAVVLAGANVSLRAFREGRYFPSENDGILMAAELLPLDLRHVELLTLSACETGLGEADEGGGLTGLSQAAAAAGVKNMVLTLWHIDDEATPELMVSFYRRFLSDGSDLQSAMSGAQRDLFLRLKADSGLYEALRLAAPFRLVSNTIRGTPRPESSNSTLPGPDRGAKWIIACEVEKERDAAETHAARWRARGLSAGVLWIPDYKSLSGANYWLAFVGPWDYASGKVKPAEILKSRVKPHYPSAYGIRLDQTPGREVF